MVVLKTAAVCEVPDGETYGGLKEEFVGFR